MSYLFGELLTVFALVEQERLTLQVYMYVLLIVVCPFVLFILVIVLSVLLRYTDSDYPFGIFKLFFPGDQISFLLGDFLTLHRVCISVHGGHV
jgi:hypothetical protein